MLLHVSSPVSCLVYPPLSAFFFLPYCQDLEAALQHLPQEVSALLAQVLSALLLLLLLVVLAPLLLVFAQSHSQSHSHSHSCSLSSAR